MRQFLLLTFPFLLACSCNDTTKKTKPDSEKNSTQNLPIKDFIKKFKTIPFPFYFNNNGWTTANIDKSKLFNLQSNSIDTLFYHLDNDDLAYGYGLLPDTTNFYSLLYFGQGDDIYPILVTYSKTGKQLSKESLIVHGCGSDCGLTFCSYSAKIEKGLDIYIADTMKYEGICDSIGNILPNSDSTYIYSKVGTVDKTGAIVLEKEKIKITKNSP